jgi:hypothetical protein
MDRLIDGLMNLWIDLLMDCWMDGWMDRWMDGHVLVMCGGLFTLEDGRYGLTIRPFGTVSEL